MEARRTREYGRFAGRLPAGRLLLACGALLLGLLVSAVAAGASPAGTCDRYASPAGSDTAAGTESAPYRTFTRLSDSLQPGETGCLRGGTYSQAALTVSRGGTADAPVALRSHPGERAKLVGRLHIAQGADHVTVAHLDLNGKNANELPSPTVNARYTTFVGNDVTNDHTGICFNLGNSTWGRAVGTVIERNRIHNCGRLPRTNLDHGIYLSRSDDVRIVDNLIYDNADRGIQLYPDAQRTYIAGNVIDGNGTGVQFSGASGVASNDNLVEHNLITNSALYNIYSWYPAGNPIGTGNVVRHNCVFGAGSRNTAGTNAYEFQASNLIADPRYVNRAAKDFSLRSDSPCLGLFGIPAPPVDGEEPGGEEPTGETGGDEPGDARDEETGGHEPSAGTGSSDPGESSETADDPEGETSDDAPADEDGEETGTEEGGEDAGSQDPSADDSSDEPGDDSGTEEGGPDAGADGPEDETGDEPEGETTGDDPEAGSHGDGTGDNEGSEDSEGETPAGDPDSETSGDDAEGGSDGEDAEGGSDGDGPEDGTDSEDPEDGAGSEDAEETGNSPPGDEEGSVDSGTGDDPETTEDEADSDEPGLDPEDGSGSEDADAADEITEPGDETTSEDSDGGDETTSEDSDAADETSSEDSDAADETSSEDAESGEGAGSEDTEDGTGSEDGESADSSGSEDTNAGDESGAEGTGPDGNESPEPGETTEPGDDPEQHPGPEGPGEEPVAEVDDPVSAPEGAPQVSFEAPTAGAKVKRKLRIRMTVAGRSAPTAVELRINGKRFRTMRSGGPYRYDVSLPRRAAKVGGKRKVLRRSKLRITARAFDAAGRSTTSGVVAKRIG